MGEQPTTDGEKKGEEPEPPKEEVKKELPPEEVDVVVVGEYHSWSPTYPNITALPSSAPP